VVLGHVGVHRLDDVGADGRRKHCGQRHLRAGRGWRMQLSTRWQGRGGCAESRLQ
jgi:hypothetical protein